MIKTMRVLFVFFFLLLLNSRLTAQDFQINEDCLLFREAKTNQSILIIEDSILLNVKSQKKTKLKHTFYPDKLIHYKNFNIRDKTYLVHDGCGPVLEYRNDSIVRIDHSSLHQNQCAAVSFVYNNEIYFFGGYGLFTFKNILTRFDFKTKEWYSVQTFGNEIPSPRSSALGILIKDNLYVFSGNEENSKNYHGYKKCENFIWKLNLVTKKWKKIGTYNEQLNFNNLFSFNIKNKLFCFDGNINNNIIEIDILNNSIKKYKSKLTIKILQINYDSNNNELAIINNQYSNQTHKYLSIKLVDFIGDIYSNETFINSKENTITKVLISVFLIILIIVLFFRNKIFNYVKPFNGIVFSKQNQSFFYKGKQISIFEETEIRILIYLIDNSNRFISLNEMNKLFENNSLVENFATTIKRRENSVNGLFLKLTLITGINENEFLISRKNPEDKRIREVKINPTFLKIK
jgi:hypothetical protein